MMDEWLRRIAALVLVAVGLACLAYAAASLYRNSSPVAPAAPVGGSAGGAEPDRRQSGAPLADSAPGGAGADSAAPAEPPDEAGDNPPAPAETPAEAPQKPTDSQVAGAPPALQPRTTPMDADDARRRAIGLWARVTSLLLVVLFAMLVLIIHRLRPRPMKRSGPTDTTDLWQEAGKRLKP
jgi:hypothetical protein